MATNSKRYRTGTVSVTNGSVNFTGTGTSWLVNVKPGDDLCLDGQQVEIDTITANGVGTLAEPWSGTTRTSVAYSIRRGSQSWTDPGSLALDIAAYIDSITAIQSATSMAIGTGSKTFAIPVLRNFLVGARVAVASTASPLNGMFGVVTAQSSGNLTVNVDVIAGSGTFTAWNIMLTGISGQGVAPSGVAGQYLRKNSSVNYDTTWVTGREVLTSARTYFVRTDGSDSNSGLSNTAGGAFLTLQKAIDTAASLDTSIYDVAIQLGAGGFNTATGVVAKQFTGSGACIIVGDETTPALTALSNSGSVGALDAVFLSAGISTIYHLRGLTIYSVASGIVFGVMATGGAKVRFQNIALGGGLTQGLRAEDEGVLRATGPWGVTAVTASQAIVTSVGNAVFRSQGFAVTGASGLTFGSFISAHTGSVQFWNASSFPGWASATAARADASSNAVINTGGAATVGSTSFFPGISAITASTGGQVI